MQIWTASVLDVVHPEGKEKRKAHADCVIHRATTVSWAVKYSC